MDPTVEASLIGAAAALIGVGGTVIVAVTAARNTRQTNQAAIDAAHADTRLTLDITREAQFTDRYSRAVEQVGSDNLAVRLGGIYALEGIALDSPRHHPIVMEFLTTFVREHSLPPPEGGRPERWPLPDVQAVLTAVSRREARHDIRHIDLTGTDLRYADLNGAHLAGADLTAVDLARTHLEGAVLTGAVLTGVNLTGADLDDARLVDADLRYADLTRANLTGADMTRADLTGADMTRVVLTGADLSGARWPEDITVPEGWGYAGDTGCLRRVGPGQSVSVRETA